MHRLKLLSLAILISLSACKTTKLSKSGSDEKDFVSTFLTMMMEDDQEGMMTCMSPTYLREYKVPNYAIINSFDLKGFEIESYDRKQGHVVALIWGKDKSWVHRLTFKVVIENNSYYLWSNDEDFTYEYMDPWILAEQWINKKD